MPSFRNKLGSIIAIIGGVFLTLGGGVGMAPLLRKIQEVVEDNISQDPNVILLFKILIMLAALGGIAVILGGILMYLEFALAAKILIALGAGIGIIGLLIGLSLAYMSGESDQYIDNIFSTLAGLGAVMAIIAYYLAK